MQRELDLFFELVGLQCQLERKEKTLLCCAAVHTPAFCRATSAVCGFRREVLTVPLWVQEI